MRFLIMKIMLNGYNGKLGRAIIEAAGEITIAAGVDINAAPVNADFPKFVKLSECGEVSDVIIDCSHHSAVSAVLEYAYSTKTPIVICTTGHTPEELTLIQSYSAKLAVFKSANMSLGVNLVAELAKKAAALLKNDYDIEIIEKHHNKKLDAPSGTALMLADEISTVFDDVNKPEYVYERQSVKRMRAKKELGIHAIRGGTIIGEHEVIFAGTNELISISHSAQSREMFAGGALAAAEFLAGKPCGLYTMKNLINEITGD